MGRVEEVEPLERNDISLLEAFNTANPAAGCLLEFCNYGIFDHISKAIGVHESSRFLTTISPMILKESKNLCNKSSCSNELRDPNLLCRKCAAYPIIPTCSVRRPVFLLRVPMFCPRVPVFQFVVPSPHRVPYPLSRVPCSYRVFKCFVPCTHRVPCPLSRVPCSYRVFRCSVPCTYRVSCPLSCVPGNAF